MIKPLISLRFLFALGVFLHHYGIGDGQVIFPEGYLGVNFFFILSGFIISYKYKQQIIDKTISKREFIIARIARIYPLHLLTFLFAFALSVRAGEFLWQASFLNIMLLQSFIPVKEYYFSFNAVSWSISNELFFYLMFPILIACFAKRKIALITTLVLIFAYFLGTIIAPEQYHHALFYVNPLIRIIDFSIGIGLFYVYEHILARYNNFAKRKNAITIIEMLSVCLLIAMIALSEYIPQVYRYASYYWVPMAMVILCFALSGTWKTGVISKILSLKAFVIAGEASFGFYMLHNHVTLVAKKIITLPAALEFLVIFALLLAASIISFYFFEKPMNMRFRRRLGVEGNL